MTRQEKIKNFWGENHEKRIELYTEYLGYKPIESITYEDECFIYDAHRYSIKEKFETPLKEFIKELFSALMHCRTVLNDEARFENLYTEYQKLVSEEK
jgi:hypothetical protein